MSKSINDLRDRLFDTLDAVTAGTMDLDRARAINEVARSVIETAKVEVEFIRATDGAESAFLKPAPALPTGITGSTVHRIAG